jgi:hypothetical protein
LYGIETRPKLLDHDASLHCDIGDTAAIRSHCHAANRAIWKARGGAGQENEVADAFHVRIITQRLRARIDSYGCHFFSPPMQRYT